MELQSKVKEKSSSKTGMFYWIKSSTIEPVVLFHAVAGGLRATPFHQLIQDKICLQDFNQTKEYCHGLSGSPHSRLKDHILAEVATFTTYKEFAILVPAMLTAFFIGSWCDQFKNGKMYCLLSSSFCQLLEAVLFLVNSLFMSAREFLYRNCVIIAIQLFIIFIPILFILINRSLLYNLLIPSAVRFRK